MRSSQGGWDLADVDDIQPLKIGLTNTTCPLPLFYSLCYTYSITAGGIPADFVCLYPSVCLSVCLSACPASVCCGQNLDIFALSSPTHQFFSHRWNIFWAESGEKNWWDISKLLYQGRLGGGGGVAAVLWILIFWNPDPDPTYQWVSDPYPDPNPASDPTWIFSNIHNINFTFVFASC
jgi:hypothetical protein